MGKHDAWTEHVRHTAREVLSGETRFIATLTAPDGSVTMNVTYEGHEVEWYVGKVGDFNSDDELHDLTAEAELHGHELRVQQKAHQQARKDAHHANLRAQHREVTP